MKKERKKMNYLKREREREREKIRVQRKKERKKGLKSYRE